MQEKICLKPPLEHYLQQPKKICYELNLKAQKEALYPILLSQPVVSTLESTTDIVQIFLSRTYTSAPQKAKAAFEEIILLSK